jgi:ATP-dependent DNA helicase RecG
MTNTSLRQRFGLESKDSSIASKIIKDAVTVGKIKPLDPIQPQGI